MQYTGGGVHIKVKDFTKSEAFYRAFGFKEVFAFGPDREVKENYNGTIFEVGGMKLEIANGHQAVKPDVFKETVRNSKISLMINVDKLSNVIEVCNKAHIDMAVGVRHYYWGTLEMVVKDPDGMVLVFIAPYDELEAKMLGAEEWGR
jgi:predicted lactoylglutathione lyase